MTDETEKTKLQVSEETQAMLAKAKQSEPVGETKEDAIVTNKLDRNTPDSAKDDTLVQTTQPTTRKIPEPQDIPRTARYGEAVLGDRAKLKIAVRGSEATPFEIEVENDFIVGRTSPETNEIPNLDLSSYGAVEKGVSRQHLAIMKRGDTLHVMDLESTNGTYLNGVWMYPRQPRVLRDGDELMLGSLVLHVRFVWQEPPPD